MIKRIVHSLVLIGVVVVINTSMLSASEIGDLINRIREVDKVEKLYTVRYNLNNIREQGGLSLKEKRELLKAYSLLTESFKNRNHFRNADIAYFDYLEILDEYHKEYSMFLTDSVKEANLKELASLKLRSNELDKQVADLESKQEIISGMKSKYYTFSIIATLLILASFLFIFFKKNKSIKEARVAIDSQQSKIKLLFRNQIEAAIAEGSVNYSRYASAKCIAQIEEMQTYFDMEKDQNANEKAILSLQDYKQLLSEKAPS